MDLVVNKIEFKGTQYRESILTEVTVLDIGANGISTEIKVHTEDGRCVAHKEERYVAYSEDAVNVYPELKIPNVSIFKDDINYFE